MQRRKSLPQHYTQITCSEICTCTYQARNVRPYLRRIYSPDDTCTSVPARTPQLCSATPRTAARQPWRTGHSIRTRRSKATTRNSAPAGIAASGRMAGRRGRTSSLWRPKPAEAIVPSCRALQSAVVTSPSKLRRCGCSAGNKKCQIRLRADS